jgi:predicted RNase H-like nuclease
MPGVVGVDGCPGGWIAVRWDPDNADTADVVLTATFAEVLALTAGVIAVDMPIGLPARRGPGGRHCDTAARAVLGARQSSLFAVPSRAAVMTADYREACAVAAATSDPPRMVAKQCFYLFPKIREIDALMTPALQVRVVESHPEVAFWAMHGDTPLPLPKKLKPGLDLRRRLLTAAGLPIAALEAQAREMPRPPSVRFRPDDLLDAAACAWVAAAVANGTARTFPEAPLRDGRGLAMAIWTGPAASAARRP